ncbi:hypothetical protein AB0I84_15555 [Streptomyces spectabilis]|uniref:Uncharacterized protein n=1 Tax=Streptomyces spectabilis TaxID=68270 RepID=A0A7W8EX87_STRST|nr:hypothetical protein [Streptomyces spectabilis]MBB5107083.1 hypothetical protein [Streptomyces spectabilis]MCI3906131.1 hypothetical protein [Streptomyces spectabilis]GGV04690.1 hypothetical protein GCM10010245_10000 [Streptomyces spectabilis]
MTTPPSPPPADPGASAPGPDRPPRRRALILGSWLWVTVPLAYGLYELVHKARQLFTG